MRLHGDVMTLFQIEGSASSSFANGEASAVILLEHRLLKEFELF